MAKNILIFADGTGQVGGVRPDQQLSNVYKLFRATRGGPDSPIDPRTQVAFYDPGIGTTSVSGSVVLGLWERIRSIASQAVGLGFSRNVIDCYEAILKRYEPGDRIYLFGFSRGAYTVRALANVLNLCGVPTLDGNGNPLPRTGRRLRAIADEAVRRVYEHGAGHPRRKFQDQREELARRFRRKYGAGQGEDRADVFPEFVGVFDSVAALGMPISTRVLIVVGSLLALGGLGWLIAQWVHVDQMPAAWQMGIGLALSGGFFMVCLFAIATVRWAPKGLMKGGPFHFAFWRGEHYDRFLDSRIPIVRHALAIDETRKHFGRVEWGGKANNDLMTGDRPRLHQRWFAGNHSDIGGSYPEDESRLSDISLGWILGEATSGPNPIIVDLNKLNRYPDPFGAQHSEVFAAKQGPWWRRLLPWPVQHRTVHPEADLDPSVIERFKASSVLDCDVSLPYRPESLRNHRDTKQFYLVDPMCPQVDADA